MIGGVAELRDGDTAGVAPAPLVRAATAADAPAIVDIYAPVVTGTVISFEEQPPNEADIRRRMAVRPRLPWLVAEADGAVAGYAYASPHRERRAYRWSADVSIYLAERHRGRGLGRLLYSRLLTEVTALGYVTVFAGVTLPNPASVGLHEAMGFTPVGVYRSVGYKHGSWHDVGWWRRALREPPTAPAEPREWSPPG